MVLLFLKRANMCGKYALLNWNEGYYEAKLNISNESHTKNAENISSAYI